MSEPSSAQSRSSTSRSPNPEVAVVDGVLLGLVEVRPGSTKESVGTVAVA